MRGIRDVFAVLFFVATGFLVSVVQAAPTGESALMGTGPGVDSVACDQVAPAPGIRG
jgi:hypothetical protein